MIEIVRFDAAQLQVHLAEFCAVLQNVVEGGASVGFLPPLSTDEALAYWQSVGEDLAKPGLILLAALQDGQVVGTVQLELAMRPNGLHRAEVKKLLVHSRARRQGIARQLMSALEDEARAAERSLLVLDTRQGDVSELLYQKIGYTIAGAIPDFARSANGQLDATVFYYKRL